MTKNEEIKILEEAIGKLGQDTYLGSMLRKALPFIESEMRSDFFPDLVSFIQVNEERAKFLLENNEKLEKKNRELQEKERRLCDSIQSFREVARDLKTKTGKLLNFFPEIC